MSENIKLSSILSAFIIIQEWNRRPVGPVMEEVKKDYHLIGGGSAALIRPLAGRPAAKNASDLLKRQMQKKKASSNAQ